MKRPPSSSSAIDPKRPKPPRRRRRCRPPPLLQETRSSSSSSVYLPEDVVFNHILPCLPLKPLCRFKTVCRSWSHFISRDPAFASAHSLRCRNPSSGLIFAACGRLHLLPTLAGNPDDVGLPDPLLSFKGDDDDGLSLSKIVASTNGLLCLLFRGDCYESLLYVCNPVTREGHFITDIKYKNDNMGLAPMSSPHIYQLVHVVRRNVDLDTVEYRFEVFSSNTNKWVESDQKVTVHGFLWANSKSVFVDGVLYWDCTEYLLWFDCRSTDPTATTTAGWLMMPSRSSAYVEADIGVWEGRLTWTRVSVEWVEVWVLSGRGDGGQWERVHCVNLEAMVADNQECFAPFWHTMNLRSQGSWERLIERIRVRPLPFEGGEMLFLRLDSRREKRLTSKKVLTEEKVLCCDMKSRRVAEVFNFMGEVGMVFGYQNTLISLPK